MSPTLAVLRDRNVALVVAARFFAAAAVTLLQSTLAWHVFSITGDPFHLGLLGLVRFAPAVPLSLLGGAIADSFDRRRVLLCAQSCTLAFASLLLATVWFGRPGIATLFALVLALGITRALENPARGALLPEVVPRESFASAVTVATTVSQLAWVLGPVTMGFLVDAGGVRAAYAATVGAIALSLSSLALVRSKSAVPERAAGERRAPTLTAIGEGLRFVVKNRPALGAMTLDLFAVIFAGATALLPVYAKEILHVGARGYGLLAASLEIGALLMAAILLTRRPIEAPGRALLGAVGVFGLATIVFGISRWFPLSVGAFVVAGMADQVSIVTRHTIIQLSTPDSLRGRVSGVNMIFIDASNQLGAAESGFLAALTSAPFAVVFGGGACLIVLALVSRAMPELGRWRAGETTAM